MFLLLWPATLDGIDTLAHHTGLGNLHPFDSAGNGEVHAYTISIFDLFQESFLDQLILAPKQELFTQAFINVGVSTILG
jgi:hypothetical protein